MSGLEQPTDETHAGDTTQKAADSQTTGAKEPVDGKAKEATGLVRQDGGGTILQALCARKHDPKRVETMGPTEVTVVTPILKNIHH